MNVTTCSRANLQEFNVENPAARRTEDYSRLVAITNTHATLAPAGISSIIPT